MVGKRKRSSSRTRASVEKTPRATQEYTLQNLSPEDNRPSADSARVPDDEPLLPTASVPHPSSGSDRGQPPARFSCTLSGIWAWMQGPPNPQKYHITAWFRRGQTAPGRLIDRYFRTTKAKAALLLACLLVWSIAFLSILHQSVAGQEIPGYGRPVKLSCEARLWSNGTNCGLDGDACRPFEKGGFAFRCPASCAEAMVLEPYFIGPQEINYKSLVIGGAPEGGDPTDHGVYRGDSAICPAAVHAGIVSNARGGCGVLQRTGEHSGFPAVDKNGVPSTDFPSNFPLSFTFDTENASAARCTDLRWPLFTFTLVVTTVLSLFITSPAAFYASIYFIIYFQVALSSDPPYSPDYYEVVSIALGRLLPCAFVGFAMYYFCVRYTLTDLEAHWDKTVLWLGPCWVGALNTDTFDKIPISRLTPHDIEQQPGAVPALLIIIGVLVTIVLTQALAFRNEGRMPRMLALYGLLVGGVLALVAVPNMNLRIHHYILSLLFLPGTTMQTRPCLLYQGLLVGLFINGIARWGFDSILQTPGHLLDGGQLGGIQPHITPPVVPSAHSISFSFPDLAPEADGISVLVNDVERFHQLKAEDGHIAEFNWTRRRDGDPEFFRFGYIQLNALGGVWYQDFTKPVTWDVEGGWNRSAPVVV